MKPKDAQKLYVVSCPKEKASEFITYHHRHHLPLDFGTYALAVCTPDGVVHGVAIIGRTTTQHMKLPGISNEWIMEVRRVATDGTINACSALYGAAWRLVKSLGYRALISYTLPEEGGSSLRALGWKRVDDVGGNPWGHRNQSKFDVHPVGKKTRWQVTADSVAPFSRVEWPVYDSIQKSLLGDAPESDGVGKFLQERIFMQTGFSDNNEIFEEPYSKG
jgi:hypothetical protein